MFLDPFHKRQPSHSLPICHILLMWNIATNDYIDIYLINLPYSQSVVWLWKVFRVMVPVFPVQRLKNFLVNAQNKLNKHVFKPHLGTSWLPLTILMSKSPVICWALSHFWHDWRQSKFACNNNLVSNSGSSWWNYNFDYLKESPNFPTVRYNIYKLHILSSHLESWNIDMRSSLYSFIRFVWKTTVLDRQIWKFNLLRTLVSS